MVSSGREVHAAADGDGVSQAPANHSKQQPNLMLPALPAAKRQRSRTATGRRTFRQQIGKAAEDIAANFLRAQGLEILERNYLRRAGELDIVGLDRGVLAIVEVRTRSSSRFGGAAASVDVRKQQRLIRASAQFLQQHKDLARLRVRFDVVVVSELGNPTPQIQWLRHAFLT